MQWVGHGNVAQAKEDMLDLLAKEVTDLRTLPVKYQHGKRTREFKDAIELLSETASLDGFPDGPRVVVEDMRSIARKGLTPQTYTAFLEGHVWHSQGRPLNP